MFAFVKDKKTFATLLQRPVTSFNVCLDSMEAKQSTVTLACDDIPASMAKNWLILNGKAYFIDRIQTDNGTTKMTLLPPWAMFSRDVVWVGSSTSRGAFIRSWMRAGWVNQTDAEYKTSYITVNNSDTTAYVDPEMDDNNVFNLVDYIVAARKSGVELASAVSTTKLTITIKTHAVQNHVLVENDGHTRLISMSVANRGAAKITIVQPSGGNITQTDYYLAADGTISTTEPAQRADGDWVLEEIGENDAPLEKAQEVFRKNGYKVEFWSDVNMDIGDTYKMRLNGEVFEGTITAKYTTSDDGRIRYSSGDLATTLTERVDRLGG